MIDLTADLTSVWIAEYQHRRQQLMEKIGSGVAIFRSAPHAVMHNDVEYNFRQDSDFFYITGFNEPNAVAILAPNHDEHKFVLFVRPKDLKAETWSGRRVGVDGAKERFGADEVYSIADLNEHLSKYLETGDRIFYRMGNAPKFDQVVIRNWQALMRKFPRKGQGPIAIEDPRAKLHSIRMVKSELELALMQKAADIAVEAHNRARELAAPGRYEYEIEAELDYCFRRSGGLGPAYPSIVAAGDNACILHYVENNQEMQAGDLLLIDAGCSVEYYNSDITRTFPVDGKFTAEQKVLYELVLKAQEAAIAEVQPGKPYMDHHNVAVRIITEGLVELGLLKGEVDDLIEKKLYETFYMHKTGHWLGLDVHDVGIYQCGDDPFYLQAGHVLTVEPGIYISPEADHPEDHRDEQPPIGDRWKGIGIRIEDNIAVTETGNKNLTEALPKQVSELETGL
ncbi:MAG: aminopeptidase P N-terminal domain-containing protein [Cyanophyceae cyanobacterium]